MRLLVVWLTNQEQRTWTWMRLPTSPRTLSIAEAFLKSKGGHQSSIEGQRTIEVVYADKCVRVHDLDGPTSPLRPRRLTASCLQRFAGLADPGAQSPKRVLLIKEASLTHHRRRDPLGKRNVMTDMMSGGSVLVMDLRELLHRKMRSGADQSRP